MKDETLLRRLREKIKVRTQIVYEHTHKLKNISTIKDHKSLKQ